MRLHVFLLALLAVSSAVRAAPTAEVAVEEREEESGEDVDISAVARAEAAAKFYNSMVNPQGAANAGQPTKGDSNVFVKVSKWTLKLVYDFVSRVYEKLKSVLTSKQSPRDSSGAPVATVTDDDMRNLYSVLYLLYNVVEGEPLEPGTPYGPSPVGAATASASASASASATATRKRSLIPEIGGGKDSLDEDDFKKAAKKTVAKVLAKLQEFIQQKEQEVKEQQLKEEQQKKGDVKATKDKKTDDSASTNDDTTKEVAADKKADKKKKSQTIPATNPREKSKPIPETN